MTMIRRGAWALLVLALLAPTTLYGQHYSAGEERPYATERDLIESTLETIVALIQEVTLQNEGSGITNRLSRLTDRLTQASKLTSTPENARTPLAPDDLDDLRDLLNEIAEDMAELRDELERDGEDDLSDRLASVHRDIRRAAREADRLAEDASRVTTNDGSRWLRPGRYGDARDERRSERERDRQQRDRKEQEDDEDCCKRWNDDDDWWRHRGWRSHAGTFVGEYGYSWPFRNETALYRSAPAIRYNRAEGFVLGVGRRPMTWDEYRRGDLYGQIGYAFALDAWRYEIGIETRVDGARHDDFAFKLGAAYHQNTGTRDAWKTSWLENSLAAFFFENDFFDYFETEGWTIYGVQRLTPFLQLSAGYRQDDYRSLEKQTGWSVFASDGGFSFNPGIDEGEMRSLVFAAEGGRVRNLHALPRGVAFRIEVETSEGMGGDFDFTRTIADGRAYLPVNRYSSLALRLRGGVAQGDFVPLQKTFTLGGIGSVRGYPQNIFPGTRMLVGNAEYIVSDIHLLDDLFDDLQLIGFFDAGWVNAFGTNELDFDDVFPSAGIGLGLDDRAVRLELAFPLRDFGDSDRDPTLWLRITPSF